MRQANHDVHVVLRGMAFRSTGRLSLSFVALLCWAALTPGSATGQAGIQTTPDGRRLLVSKDVGGERWAITRNLADGSVTGNIFTTGSGDPLFVACEALGETGDQVRLRCEGADRCPLTPCEQHEWAFIAEVEVPKSFFGDESASSSVSGASVPRIVAARVAGVAQASRAGVQQTPNGVGTLINKDVGEGQRWAITLNGDDGTVTGNVFFPDGSEPAFVWCGRTAVGDEDFEFDCWGADRCAASGCTAGDWSLLFAVSIESAFFLAPGQATVDELDAALFGSLGATGSFDAMINAFAKGYSFRQVARGGLSGRIQPPGDILDNSGEIVPPDDPPSSAGASTSVEHISRVDPIDPEALRRQLEQRPNFAEGQFTRFFLFLINRGYSEQQIIDAVEEERLFISDESAGQGVTYDSAFITDDKGRPVDPSPIRGLDVLLPPSATARLCGNKRLEPGESCEPEVSFPQSCETFGFDGGTLTCAPTVCRFDTNECQACGNRHAEGDEACDGPDVRKQTCRDLGIETDATPGCTNDCELDPTPCDRAVEDGCPDGDLDPGEDCDGAALRLSSCKDLGPQFDRGRLGCDLLTCRYDTSGCLRVAEQDGCGDGNLDDGEQCDGATLRQTDCKTYDSSTFLSGSLDCLESCAYDTSGCQREPEGICGNGRIEPGEECDGAAVSEADCEAVDPSLEGPLVCSSDCTYDLSRCAGCGNAVLDDDENCEPGILGAFTCATLDFGPGTLRCNVRCDFDTSGCGPALTVCGDGNREGSEQCDGGDLDGESCSSLGFGSGPGLGCSTGCRFQTGGCPLAAECGNDLIEAAEVCDGSDLDGQDCNDFGFGPGGSLACSGDCSAYDMSSCVPDTPPTVTSVSPASLVLPTGGSGFFNIFWSDPNGDAVQGCIGGGAGFTGGCSDFNSGGATSGSIGGTLFCSSTPNTFPFNAWVIDSQGNQSNLVGAQLVCQ